MNIRASDHGWRDRNTTCRTPARYAAPNAGSRSRRTFDSWGGRTRNITRTPVKAAVQVAGSVKSEHSGGGLLPVPAPQRRSATAPLTGYIAGGSGDQDRRQHACTVHARRAKVEGGVAVVEKSDLAGLDDALVRLRRLWSTPRQMVIDDNGRHIEMSSVLVVEACATAVARGELIGVAEVAEFVDVAPSTASRLVDRAVHAGLVRKSPAQHDGRRNMIELTPADQALRDRASTARLAWLHGVVTGWPDADLTTLVTLLQRFADAVATTPAGPPPASHH